MDRLILDRLTTHLSNSILPESQCRFRPGRKNSRHDFSAYQIQSREVQRVVHRPIHCFH